MSFFSGKFPPTRSQISEDEACMLRSHDLFFWSNKKPFEGDAFRFPVASTPFADATDPVFLATDPPTGSSIEGLQHLRS